MARLTIVGARIVDVVEGALTEPRTIAIEGDRIVGIDPVHGFEPGALDGHGRFVAPGLIDAHVHLVLGGGPDPIAAYRATDPEDLLELARRNARVALEAGITTVRDLGAPLAVVAAASTAVPNVVFAGAAVTRPAGHIGLFGGEVADLDEARALVVRQIKAGARAVKLVVSGGGLTPGTRPDLCELPAAVASAAMEVAHDAGVPVAAHCHASDAIRLALDVGVATIEHASFLDPGGIVAFDRDLALRVRNAPAAVVPTAIGALRSATRYRVAGAHNRADRNAVARLEARPTIAGELHALGVPIVAGTDAGVTDTPFDSLHDELAIYVDVGFSPLEAIRTATINAATWLRLPERGIVEVGRRADLVILDDDPLRDINALRTPVSVIAGGRLIRSSLPAPPQP
jgi:imidazolonepropionase-like amidohydrolase